MYIRDVVDQALTTGILSLEAEAQLRILLSNKYSYEDWQAFMMLQSAAMTGQVQQASRVLESAIQSAATVRAEAIAVTR